MLSLILVGVVSLATGFGLGRIKNKAKLSAVQTELDKLKASLTSVVSSVVADVKKL